MARARSLVLLDSARARRRGPTRAAPFRGRFARRTVFGGAQRTPPRYNCAACGRDVRAADIYTIVSYRCQSCEFHWRLILAPPRDTCYSSTNAHPVLGCQKKGHRPSMKTYHTYHTMMIKFATLFFCHGHCHSDRYETWLQHRLCLYRIQKPICVSTTETCAE